MRDYADRQMLMRSIAQLLQVSKASEEGSIQSRSSNNKQPRFLKPRVRYTAQQALLVQILSKFTGATRCGPEDIRKPDTCPSPLPWRPQAHDSPSRNQTKPLGCVMPVPTFLPMVPSLTAKRTNSRRADAPRLTGGSFWCSSSPARVEQGPLPVPRARRPGTQAAPQHRQAAVGYLLTRRLRPDFPH